MPWKSMSIMQNRREFIGLALLHDVSVAALWRGLARHSSCAGEKLNLMVIPGRRRCGGASARQKSRGCRCRAQPALCRRSPRRNAL